MDLLQKDVPILTKIYEAKCFYDSQNNRVILYYKNHVTARTLVDFYNLPTTPPPNSSLYVIYDLQTGTFNVSTDPPTYTVRNSKVYVTSPINAEYDMDKVIIYRISWYETDTDIDLNYILNTFVRKQQADTITATHTFDPTQPGPAFQLGPNAQNQLIRYLNADKVDGFNASLIPAPNTIVPLNASGILDLSATYVRSNVYTFRRVDLTNATSDYDLQVGEEAIINFGNTVSVPLRIVTVSNRLYEMYIYNSRNLNSSISFTPNNTFYASSFASLIITWDTGSNSPSVYSETSSNRFSLGAFALSTVYSIIDIRSRIVQGFSAYNTTNITRYATFSSCWHSNLDIWTSLGTLNFGVSATGYVLVRRLL